MSLNNSKNQFAGCASLLNIGSQKDNRTIYKAGGISNNQGISISTFQNLNFNFLTLNIRGLNGLAKADFLRDYLIEKNVGICYLQETHVNCPDHICLLEEIFREYFCFFTLGSSKTKGVGILIKKSCEIKILGNFPKKPYVSC